MKSVSAFSKWVFVLLLAGLLPLFHGCSDSYSQKNFVGKWQSSRMQTTPVYLYENGEWEIRQDDGSVMQFGIWKYKNKTIVWEYKINEQMGRDPTPVLSASSKEFQLRESDNSVTTFRRLD